MENHSAQRVRTLRRASRIRDAIPHAFLLLTFSGLFSLDAKEIRKGSLVCSSRGTITRGWSAFVAGNPLEVARMNEECGMAPRAFPIQSLRCVDADADHVAACEILSSSFNRPMWTVSDFIAPDGDHEANRLISLPSRLAFVNTDVIIEFVRTGKDGVEAIETKRESLIATGKAIRLPARAYLAVKSIPGNGDDPGFIGILVTQGSWTNRDDQIRGKGKMYYIVAHAAEQKLLPLEPFKVPLE